ncbi:uncharacterized protein N0V89_007107 [Didymosphaeria variabile]|uniref:Uncharacterized protein n=1 Tax=Didymosphaeria variabile TaxID=1932322 RepID=A0A9W8XIU0_9PLEO|nr:uncharacterized protein N0V89_007107 [Didymosphaeria variabile]KAJ4351764.1 hypothetical protein N0V89_007107 [Didymosphaeria variabile]
MGNESQRWCCGTSQDCCNEDSGLGIEYLPITFDPKSFTDAFASSSFSVASSKPTSSATKTPSSSAVAPASTSASHSTASPSPALTSTPSSTSSSEPSTGLSTGAKAGVGVGVSAAALALIGLGIIWGRRKSAYTFDPASDSVPLEKDATVYAHWDHSQGGTSYEGPVMPPPTPRKDNEVQIHEMPCFESRKELDGGSVDEVKTKKMYA